MDPHAGKHYPVNKRSREELIRILEEEDFRRITVSFYRYVILEDPWEMRNNLFNTWSSFNINGRIYIAREGINAQMSVPEHHWDAFVTDLHSRPEFAAIPFKIAVEDNGKSFYKLIIKVRNKIVADGLDDDAFDVTNVGTHLDAERWNEAVTRPGAVVVDMRNFYESEVGRFEGALLPKAETFRDELPEVLEMLKGKENEKILLYCTGGIRCEKASAWLRHHGFSDVNQLHGGIIDYARQIKAKNLPNQFRGVNFVFDDRLGERISSDIIAECHQCASPWDKHTNCRNTACNLLFIQCETCAEEYQGCCSKHCAEQLDKPAAERTPPDMEKTGRRRIFHSSGT